MGAKFLIVGAVINFLISLGHFAALFFLDWAFTFTGVAVYTDQYNLSPWMYYALTAFVAIAFMVMAIYGLSCARVIKKLPLLKPVTFFITFVYLTRGILGLAYEILSQEQMLNGIIFASIALLVGFCYLIGALWRWHGRGQGKYFPERPKETIN